MSKIQIWLSNPEADYNQGVAIFAEAKPKELAQIKFFESEKDCKPDSMHYQMLANELKRAYRIELQNAPKAKPEEVKVEEPTAAAKGKRTKETTNALLRLPWEELSDAQKKYFLGSENVFAEKKEQFTAATQIRAEKSALHEKMKAATTDEERAPLTEQIVELDGKEAELWKQIDNFKNLEK